MKCGIQIASMLFMIVILFNYFSHKRLPIRSTRAFTAFLIVAIINTIFEWLTIYTINNPAIRDTIINRLVHQIFIFSIDAIAFVLFLYIDIRSREQKKYTVLEIIIRIIPLTITAICISFFDIYYYVGPDGFYSYGPIANTIFISVPIYLLLVIYKLFKHKKAFSRDEVLTIIMGVISWLIIISVQYFKPTYLLSSLAIALMSEFLFISFENSSRYLFKDDKNIFTKSAFDTTIKEFYGLKKEFNVVKISVGGLDIFDDVIKSYQNSLIKKTNGRFFNYGNNTVCALILNSGEYYSFLTSIPSSINYLYNDKEYKLCITKKGLDSNDFESYQEMNTALNLEENSLVAFKKNIRYKLKYTDVFYIEALEHQTFLYTINDCYESKDKLYKLEVMLLPYGFIRSSKSMLVNIEKIVSINNIENSKMVAILTNGEQIVVSRKYMKELKEKFTNK